MQKHLLFLALSFPMVANANVAHCLAAAYSNTIKALDANTIMFNNGVKMSTGTVSNKPFRKILDNPSLADQLSQRYPLNFVVPKQYEDAGRIRNDDFFKNMYGSNFAQVRQNMTSVRWLPSGGNVQFNRLNGAAEKLQQVGNEIAQYPELKSYVSHTLGSLNFRKIAGTNRLSAHSFGIAIDFQLPKHLHKYWRWDGCTTEDKVCPFPTQLMQDQNLQRIVQIFEKHGFIWGGKWASYDSVHFEYRPELLISQCR